MSNRKPIVVVTGSSTGIGLELCLDLAHHNCSVVATLRTPSSAHPSLRDSPCDIQQLDVTCEESARALTAYLRETYGGCDVLINNAGWGMPGTLETVLIEEAKRVFDVNVWGVMRMCQHIVPLMRARGGGLVVTVSSTSGWRGLPCSDIYTGSKHAIEGMMESFRYSVLPDNIKVCMVNPGPTATAFSKRFKEELVPGTRDVKDALKLQRLLVQEYIGKIEKRNAEGQTAADCARAIVGVVNRELPRNASHEDERIVFFNPTSEFGRTVLKNASISQDGCNGALYDAIYEEVWSTFAKLKAESEH